MMDEDDFRVIGPNDSRLNSYTKMDGKTIAVSGTQRAVDQAGVADEYAYQLKKRGTEMRRDIREEQILEAYAAVGYTETKWEDLLPIERNRWREQNRLYNLQGNYGCKLNKGSWFELIRK